jgi:hypothetical protein
MWIVYDASIMNPSYNSAKTREEAERIAKDRASSMRRPMRIAQVVVEVREVTPLVFVLVAVTE